MSRNRIILVSLILSASYFLSIGHHTIQFWEKPGRLMLGLSLICIPLLTWIVFLVINQIQPQLNKSGRKQFLVFIIPALLISAAITWRYYSMPATFHTIIIDPVVTQNQKVEIIEIKANGRIIPQNEKNALDYDWQVKDGVLFATSKSRPIKIIFKTEINAAVRLLFLASPQGGKAVIDLEKEQIEVDLKNPENRQQTSTIYIQSSRGIPNWLFVPMLVMVDIITIASFFLFIYLIQKAGEKRMAMLAPTTVSLLNHRVNIAILLFISSILHILNSLAAPLILDVDSISHLQGAIHLLEFGNLDGVSMIRGPGSTFLFAPFLFLFGRNPWGIKMLLHLLAIACVPVSYRISWQLCKNQTVAFVCGLVVALSPDLFFYSNFVMSDLPNLFFVLVFCTLLISALETFEFRWVISAMLLASFSTLFRSENITLLLIGAGALLASYIWQWKAKGFARPIRDLSMFGLVIIFAVLPLLWWSGQNQRIYGFFGLSNYAGEVFYDGWVYFGDASKLAYTDKNSPAVQKIQATIDRYPIIITDKSGVPTGWEIYPSLIKAGYTTELGFDLLKQAALDSIKKDWSLTYQLLLIKIRAGLRPETTNMHTLALPSENYQTQKLGYFDQENLIIPALILAQRTGYTYIQRWFDSYYPWWVYLCIVAMFFCLYRSPGTVWLTLILIIGTRIFIPNIMGLSHWRYTLAGLMPLQILAIDWLAGLIKGGESFVYHKNTIIAPSCPSR